MNNTDDRFVINRKIENIILNKGLTSSHFADDIDVPRSSISHILANRNKPSLDIINKIIKKYPDISFEWLMNGELIRTEGIEKQSNNQEQIANQFVKPEGNDKASGYISVEQKEVSRKYRNNEQQVTKISTTEDRPNTNYIKKIARVMVFYTDNTFDTYEST